MIDTTPSTSDINLAELCDKNNPARIGGDVETIDDIIAFLSRSGIEISTTRRIFNEKSKFKFGVILPKKR